MPILVSQINIGLGKDDQAAINKAIKMLAIKFDDIKNASVIKKSIDARKKNDIKIACTVFIELKDEKLEKLVAKNNLRVVLKSKETIKPEFGNEKLVGRPIIVGFGPAGIFSAYMLAKYGYRPIVIERGSDIDRRVQEVEKFWSECKLNEQTNVQFGEGGAGTFSDGKLTTRINDPFCSMVLDLFVKHGAPKDITMRSKPHIGTDLLRNIIKSIRKEIILMGAEVRFDTKLESLNLNLGRLSSIKTNDQELKTNALVLAIGHSARDTFSMLLENGIELVSKSFSIGFRIEHLQEEIDRALYGKYAGHKLLPKGEYTYSYRTGDRGVYTFCMCPGGVVVPSSSEAFGVVTNGMSEYARNGKNSNSAVVVGVSPKDFGNKPLDGVNFQREIERCAFKLAGSCYFAPIAIVDSYLNGSTYKEGRVKQTYACGTTPADISQLFPSYVNDMLKIGLRAFDKKLPGFASPDSIITAPETRTSSPVRIVRDENFTSCCGIYPCGEGAGYAGGIMSAAVDGIRVAFAIMKRFAPK